MLTAAYSVFRFRSGPAESSSLLLYVLLFIITMETVHVVYGFDPLMFTGLEVHNQSASAHAPPPECKPQTEGSPDFTVFLLVH